MVCPLSFSTVCHQLELGVQRIANDSFLAILIAYFAIGALVVCILHPQNEHITVPVTQVIVINLDNHISTIAFVILGSLYLMDFRVYVNLVPSF